MESSYQKYAKDALVVGVGMVLANLAGVILMSLLTKGLGAHDYGIWAQVDVTKNLFMVSVGLGLPYAMFRFLPAKTSKEEIQEEFYSVLCLESLVSLTMSLLLIVFAAPIANAFFDGATQIVRIVGLICFSWSLDWICLSFFRTFRQMKRFFIFTVVDAYALASLATYLVLNGHGLFSVVIALLAVKVVLFPILLYSVKSQIGIKRPRFSRVREYLSFSVPTIPGDISSWVVSLCDRYVIGYFLGAASVGIYSASYAIARLGPMAAGIVSFALVPALSKLYDEGKMNEVKTHLSYSLKYYLLFAIPFTFGAAILAEPVLRLFSTPEIASQGRFILPILASSMVFLGIYPIISPILALVKRTKIMGATWVIAALVNLSLNILIVPRLGILGAAITTLIAYALALGITVYFALKEIRFNIQWNYVFKSLVASIIMSLVIWRIDSVGLNVIWTVIVGIIVYAAALVLFKGFKREEWHFARELFKRYK